MESILRHINQQKDVDTVILAGDFNQPYYADYTSLEWKLISNNLRELNLPIIDGVGGLLKESKFQDSFRDQDSPKTSAWNGARVDFMYYRCNSFKGHFERTNSQFYYSDASDHFPLVVDFVHNY